MVGKSATEEAVRAGYFLKNQPSQVTWQAQVFGLAGRGETCRNSGSLYDQDSGQICKLQALHQVLIVDRIQRGPNEASVPSAQNP